MRRRSSIAIHNIGRSRRRGIGKSLNAAHTGPRRKISASPVRVSKTRTRAAASRRQEIREVRKRMISSEFHPILPPARERVYVEPEIERRRYDSNSALNLYLQEIGRTPLLTPQEEIILAARIKKGDAPAREQMIKANLRLVVKIARDYEHYGMPLLDLINEGNIGLMKGVDRFDPSKGAKFSTYGAWWIKQSIKRALANQSKTIRLPVHVVDKVAHIRRTGLKLHELLGREPDDEEIAEELGTSPSRIRQYRAAAVTPMSLDSPVGEDESRRVGDVVEDERAESPYEELEGKTSEAMVHQMLRKLHPREAAILNLRFNLDGEREQTLEEIGEQFGVTRERIRQIQQSALKKLRRMIEKFEAPSLAEPQPA
jgi:RNA polymerase primary sigma factor